MARSRVKVSPKISSHRAGWIALVISSVRSWRSFCNSTRHIVPTRATTRPAKPKRRGRVAPADSTEAWSGTSSGADIAHPFPCAGTEVIAGGGAEHVVEGGVVADHRLQFGRRAFRSDPTAVHERDPVALLVGLVHVMRGHQHSHAGSGADL